jgi:hypothetical protein
LSDGITKASYVVRTVGVTNNVKSRRKVERVMGMEIATKNPYILSTQDSSKRLMEKQ